MELARILYGCSVLAFFNIAVIISHNGGERTTSLPKRSISFSDTVLIYELTLFGSLALHLTTIVPYIIVLDPLFKRRTHTVLVHQV